VDFRALVGYRTVDELVSTAAARLRASGSKITNWNVGGVARTLVEVCMQAVADLYELLCAVVAQGYVTTATGKWLDLKAEEIGLSRIAATKTRGLLRFWRSSSEGIVVIPAGTIVATKPSVQGEILKFRVAEQAVIPEGEDSVYAVIEAEAPGARYNLPLGTITEIVTYVDGVDEIIHDLPPGRDTWITQPGCDEETDEALRRRCLLRWSELTYGATRDAYIAWAMSVQGVSDCAVLDRFPRGPGTVDVVIMGTSGLPSPELIKTVRMVIDQRRPICADVLVRGPKPVTRPVRLRVFASANPNEVRNQIADILQSLFSSGHRKEAPRLLVGQWPYRARLVALAMSVDGVTNCVVEEPAQDEDLASDEIFLAQSVEIICEASA
jgi:uncharacterized phage protein gp47/JayE